MSRNLYNEVTSRMITLLEAGTVPWVKPWTGRATAGSLIPCNATTNRPYSGVNIPLLWVASDARGFAATRWLTFKQALDLGGHVRKGETGTKIYFVKQLIATKNADGDDLANPRSIPMLREYTVFNIAQCDGLPEKITTLPTLAPRHNDARDAQIDGFVACTGADLRHGGNRAFYTTAHDYIAMPHFADFRTASAYYATLFHEIGHWTGAKPRMDRDLSGRFGNRAYAAEELIAEMTSAFLCAEFALGSGSTQLEAQSAAYLKSWLDLLRDDNRAIFTAASRASAAAEYLRGLALAEPQRLAA